MTDMHEVLEATDKSNRILCMLTKSVIVFILLLFSNFKLGGVLPHPTWYPSTTAGDKSEFKTGET